MLARQDQIIAVLRWSGGYPLQRRKSLATCSLQGSDTQLSKAASLRIHGYYSGVLACAVPVYALEFVWPSSSLTSDRYFF